MSTKNPIQFPEWVFLKEGVQRESVAVMDQKKENMSARREPPVFERGPEIIPRGVKPSCFS